MTARYRRSCWTRYHPREAITRTIISRSLPEVVGHPSTAHSIGRQFSKCKYECRAFEGYWSGILVIKFVRVFVVDEWHLGTNLTMMMMISHMCWRITSHRITNGVPDLNHHTVHIVVHCSSYHHHFRIEPLHIHFSTEIVDNFEKSDCEVVGLHDPL
jgi:hypothetical protein